MKKSFDITQDHFMEQYGKKVRFFVYNSSNLNQLDAFSSNSGINVMIINMQAFNISMKEGGKSKESRIIYSDIKRGSDFSDDISAYDLILKNKERLLSFSEPTRFIFSHSALREGWDNPNVFQICTLKHSDSTTMKRQEVGRGLRLCVNQEGFRMDEQNIGRDLVHKVDKLTVVASESYKQFVTDLQRQIKEVLYDRPTKASKEYFVGKTIQALQRKVWNVSLQKSWMVQKKYVYMLNYRKALRYQHL